MVSSDGCNEVITQFSGPIAHTKSLYFRSSQFVGAVLLPSGLRARNAGRKGGTNATNEACAMGQPYEDVCPSRVVLCGPSAELLLFQSQCLTHALSLTAH